VGLAAPVAWIAAAAWASPLSYTEPPDLDFPVADLGSLEVGTNTVTGSISCAQVFCTVGDGFDSFSVVLPEGHQITAVTVTIANFSVGFPPNVGGIAEVTLPARSFRQRFFSNGQFNVITGAAPGPGTVVFGMGTRCLGGACDVYSASYNYVWSISVVRAQEAATVPLLSQPALIVFLCATVLAIASRAFPAWPARRAYISKKKAR